LMPDLQERRAAAATLGLGKEIFDSGA
jgi:hypothetical protein